MGSDRYSVIVRMGLNPCKMFDGEKLSQFQSFLFLLDSHKQTIPTVLVDSVWFTEFTVFKEQSVETSSLRVLIPRRPEQGTLLTLPS